MWVRACGRVVLGWLVSGLWLASSAWGWVLAINEGVSYQHQPAEVAARYSEVAADLSRLLGQAVTVEVVSDYAALRKGLAERRFGLALVHPAHVSLRDAGIRPQDVKLTYTRFQDAVPFFIDSGLTQAGATASAKVIKAWTDQGGRVLTTSRPVPIKHVIASPALSAQQQTLVREYLLKLDTSPEGRQRLASIRYSGFEPYDENALLALAVWLKK
ncbi:phosphate/phosphite/phosphonate ABC transporter substrate-binding protein [Vitreoscilla filiformis]|nr:PhnD/SsuA/transferrin family substrate-binding protein [Vitreoscilla filiformis]